MVEIKELWNKVPGGNETIPTIEVYLPSEKKTDAAIVIFPGGGYTHRAKHEGEGYAEFFANLGITSFVVQYRVSPYTFPIELLDARRGICFVRANAEKYGIDKNRIAVIGSSAGGHLAALVSTYTKELKIDGKDEVDNEDYIPNATILCYPVIASPQKTYSHTMSYDSLVGGENMQLMEELDPLENVTKNTPPTFIWHSFADPVVNVKNSLAYADKLKDFEVPTELHVFPKGNHGVGLAKGCSHLELWTDLLIDWLKELGWLER